MQIGDERGEKIPIPSPLRQWRSCSQGLPRDSVSSAAFVQGCKQTTHHHAPYHISLAWSCRFAERELLEKDKDAKVAGKAENKHFL